MKECRFDFRDGWTPLVDEVRLVLFYEGLHDPIRSHSDHRQPTACSRTPWPTIPSGFNLLMASLLRLIDIARRFGPGMNKLTATHQWHSPQCGRLLGPCDSTTEHACDGLQEVRRIAFGRPDPLPRRFPIDQRGAVVFKYTTSMDRIQQSFSLSMTVYSPPLPVPSQVTVETAHNDDHV